MNDYIIAELEPPCLFRIDNAWYRLVSHERTKSTVITVGPEPSTIKLDASQVVTEVSVLSKS